MGGNFFLARDNKNITLCRLVSHHLNTLNSSCNATLGKTSDMRKNGSDLVIYLLWGVVSLSRGAPLPDVYQNVRIFSILSITFEEHWVVPTLVDLFLNSPTISPINGQSLSPNLT